MPLCVGAAEHAAKAARKAGRAGKGKAADAGGGKDKDATRRALPETAVAGLKAALVDTYRTIQKLRNFGIGARAPCVRRPRAYAGRSAARGRPAGRSRSATPPLRRAAVNYSGFVKIFKKYRKRAYAPRVEAIEEVRRVEVLAARAASAFLHRQHSSGSAILRSLMRGSTGAPAGAAGNSSGITRTRAHSVAVVGRARGAVARALRSALGAERAGGAHAPLLPLAEQRAVDDAAAGALGPVGAGSSRRAGGTSARRDSDGYGKPLLQQRLAPRRAGAGADGADGERSPEDARPILDERAPPSLALPLAERMSSFGPCSSSLDLVALFASGTTTSLARGCSRSDRDEGSDGAEAVAVLADPTEPYMHALGTCAFADFARVEALINEVEALFASAFSDGNMHLARSALLVRHSRERANWRHGQRGTKVGIVLMLLIWLSWDVLVDWSPDRASPALAPARGRAWLRTVLPLYRGCGLLGLALWVSAGCLSLCTRARINYVYLLDEPALANASGALFDSAANYSICFLLSLLFSLKAVRGMGPHARINPGVYPTCTALSLPATVLLPPRRGRALLRVLARVLSGPFVESTFLVAFAADILTSLVKPLVDVAYAVCYVGSGEALLPLDEQGACAASGALNSVITPVLLAGPTFLRLCQNLRKYYDGRHRHPSLTNALKYLCSLAVSLLGTFHKEFGSVRLSGGAIPTFQLAWLSLYAASSLYAFCWDVLVDWGLGQRARRLPAPPPTAILRDGHLPAELKPTATSSSLARARDLRRDASSSTTAGSGANGAAAVGGTGGGGSQSSVETRASSSPAASGGASGAPPALAERRVPCGLREHLLYRNPALYYCAIVADLFGRFVFIYTLVPKGAHLGGGYVLTERIFLSLGPFIAAIEIARRGMWSLLRLENQQLGSGPDRPTTTDSIPLHFDKAEASARSGEEEDERSVAAALLEVVAFLAAAGAVLAFAVATRTDHE